MANKKIILISLIVLNVMIGIGTLIVSSNSKEKRKFENILKGFNHFFLIILLFFVVGGYIFPMIGIELNPMKTFLICYTIGLFMMWMFSFNSTISKKENETKIIIPMNLLNILFCVFLVYALILQPKRTSTTTTPIVTDDDISATEEILSLQLPDVNIKPKSLPDVVNLNPESSYNIVKDSSSNVIGDEELFKEITKIQ